jgi:hypothetical protein
MMNFFTGFWANRLNRGKLLLFLGGKASIKFLPRHRPHEKGIHHRGAENAEVRMDLSLAWV